MSDPRRRNRSERNPKGMDREEESDALEVIQLGSVRYEVLERLSQVDRGRLLVRNPRPYPKGRLHTAILLPNNAASAQLRRSLLRLPSHASSFPTLVDHGRYGDQYFFLLEWFPGVTLDRYLKKVRDQKTPPPSPTECMRLFRGLAHTLRILHEIAQIVHGDLKPANLVLTSRPSSLRLIDFGSSWQLERTSRKLPGDGSDALFQAPEYHLADQYPDTRSDQFSLGVNLYLMLTRQIPFDGLGGKIGHEDFREEFKKEAQPLIPPSQLLSAKGKIPTAILESLDEVLSRLLRLNPDERFPSMRACAEAFDRFAALVKVTQHGVSELNTSRDASSRNWLKRIRDWFQ